ncbi:hypothetical protein AMAG_15190 [Allomyces macrogynus ATCC 38327]|uniref:Rieske domain-containing protein n=1 Tax=Allomyces macrogynus (strain ATCC 38327) TaxID=578462 RepID=A0A0L0T6A8_ALLM3|nr:hypothetical protein AMAG_15190 [Allomyces macrogynus ATCC 38327]|eukprot:KNE70221.1 hypothetical protein AMAG_15190 [Allomyces macrogynus ATCC 38327]
MARSKPSSKVEYDRSGSGADSGRVCPSATSPAKAAKKDKSKGTAAGPADPSMPSLDTYLAYKPTTNATASAAPSSATSAPAPPTFPLASTMRVAAVIDALAAVHGWTRDEAAADVAALAAQRHRTVGDLRLLSKKGWKHLPVVPIVAELLHRVVWAGVGKADVKRFEGVVMDAFLVQVGREKVETSQSVESVPDQVAPEPVPTMRAVSASAAPTANNGGPLVVGAATDMNALAKQLLGFSSTAPQAVVASPEVPASNDPDALVRALLYDGGVRPPSPIRVPKPAAPPITDDVASPAPEPVLSARDCSAQELVHALLKTDLMVAEQPPEPESDLVELVEGTSRAAPQLGLVPGNPNRIRVAGAGGKVYEVDRYCPHKQYDMLKAPPVRGSILTCPKHNWDFDLSKGGVCVGRPGKSLKCAVVPEW